MSRRRGFTLMEVLIAVAVSGLMIAAGFRLVAMSLRSLSAAQQERALTAAAEKLWLRFRTEERMPDSGKEEGVEWRTEENSLPIGEFELPYKRVTVTVGGRSMAIYLPR